ncbi:MAG TPA: response regulator [Nitrococcus sp.]|nr:response regulator [Nitrococcus sp.]
MSSQGTVYVVDDSVEVRESLTVLLRSRGLQSACFPDAPAFLNACPPSASGCLIVDVRMPGLSGLDLQQQLHDRGYTLPVIVITGHGDVPMAVRALKAGALDFIEKPFASSSLIPLINEALVLDARLRARRCEEATLRARLALLAPREREILRQIVNGRYNKVIAADLGVSVSTVETHRKKIMEKLHANSLYDLVRMAELDRDSEGTQR